MSRDLTKWEKERSVLFESDGATYVTLKLQETDLSLDDFNNEIREYIQGRLFEDMG